MDFVRLDNQTPEELDAEWGDIEDAERAKRLKYDGLLGEYYIEDIDDDSDEGVVRVGYSDDLGHILEKRLKTESELGYTVLADILGVGPTTYYVRRIGDDLFLGEDFKREFGMFEDLDYDGFDDFLDYTYAVGKAAGRIWDANIMHDDLVRSEMRGRFGNTQYVANIMVSGPDDEAEIIDMERARFEDWASVNGIGTNMHESVEDEKNAVKSAIMSEVLRSFDDKIERLYMDDGAVEDLLKLNDLGIKVVDEENLPEGLEAMIDGTPKQPGVKKTFDKGVADGRINPVSAINYVEQNKPFKLDDEVSSKPDELAEHIFHVADHWIAENLEE